MFNLELVSDYIGWIMVVVSFAYLVINPLVRSFTKINTTLIEINTVLAIMTRDLEDSKQDRKDIREILKELDRRIEAIDRVVAVHIEKGEYNDGIK